MNSDRPIGEEDLHAYVDMALDATRHEEVRAYLEQHPEVQARIERYATRRAALRDALRPIAEEPVPTELSLRRFVENKRRRAGPSWSQAAAAAMVLLVVGAAGGWSARDAVHTPPVGVAALAEEGAASFRAYADDRDYPVELRAADRPQLASWINQRLRHDVTIPDLGTSGFRLMGGRVVPTVHGAAAMFMYDDDHGTRITMLVRPMRPDREQVDRDMPMSAQTIDGVNGYSWTHDGLGYSLAGDIPSANLHPLADAIRTQVARR